MASALIRFEDRSSDSPVVERVWRSYSERAGTFLSMASCHCMMVVTRHEGKTFLTVRGPETRATSADCPAAGEWVGIYFKLGTFMPLLPAGVLRDRHDVRLPASDRSFWLNGCAWEYPSFDNAETFVARLLKQGLIATDPHVQPALGGDPRRLSRRTQQRHLLRATGMTSVTIRQIERARRATQLLRNGRALIADVALDAGYFDQAHLTRSLKHFIGQTPAQIARGQEQLSLLYNTNGG